MIERMRDAFSFVLILLFAIMVFAILLAISYGVTYGAKSYECSKYAEVTGETSRMVTIQCYVREGSTWVTLESHTANHHIQVKP